MPRFSRGSIKTSYFHVMTQGINKSYIFDKPEDIKYYIKIMYELKEEHNLKIIAYCVMNNHTHMLIHAEKTEELSKYMQRLNSKYARFYNKKYNRVGYVFRDRYKSEGLFSEKQYFSCIKYIYDNPVKAGICNRPEQYPYSNYKFISNEMINDNYHFVDIEDEITGDYLVEINKFLKNKGMNLDDLKKNKEEIKEIATILKKKYNLSLRKIAEILVIGRETLRKICIR